ncbi:MAG TPA: mevalonate kinase [Caldilineae bacterium]|nr:mevalonate kinase [Caldilineae bacterium]
MNTLRSRPATGHAPGKIILFGEHAVVYGRAAIAAPIPQLQAHAEIHPADRCLLQAVDLNQTIDIAQAPEDDPFALIVRLVCAERDRPLPPWRIVVRSEIPIASGLGSGAAIATAIARAMLAAFRAEMTLDRLNALVYEVEKLHHGTPSGIDNTVVVYGRPVWFVQGQSPQPFAVGEPLHLLIADTGIASPTKVTVGDVRRGWLSEPKRYEALFDRIHEIALLAYRAIEGGDVATLGPLLDENQALLTDLDVSSPPLERLCAAAHAAGALGAKLSGGGRGGNMIALVEPEKQADVKQALERAGAKRVIEMVLGGP